MRERERGTRTKRVEGYMLAGQEQSSLRSEREAERFYPVSNPLRLIRKASHDTSDLFPPFLGIILYIQSPLFLSLLSLSLSFQSIHRGFPRSSSLTRLPPDEITHRYVEVPSIHPRFCRREEKIPRTPDAASRGSCSCRENGDAFINPYRGVYHCVSGHAT